jgi:hypothetical protein
MDNTVTWKVGADVPAWSAGVKTVGQRVVASPDNGFYFECVKGGTDTVQPSPWPTAAFGLQVTSEGLIWRNQGFRVQAALFKNYGAIVA